MHTEVGVSMPLQPAFDTGHAFLLCIRARPSTRLCGFRAVSLDIGPVALQLRAESLGDS